MSAPTSSLRLVARTARLCLILWARSELSELTSMLPTVSSTPAYPPCFLTLTSMGTSHWQPTHRDCPGVWEPSGLLEVCGESLEVGSQEILFRDQPACRKLLLIHDGILGKLHGSAA